MSKLNRLSNSVVFGTSSWVAANPTSARLALVVLSAVMASLSVLFNVNPVAACDGLTSGGGGC
jgi:hypothetical protein